MIKKINTLALSFIALLSFSSFVFAADDVAPVSSNLHIGYVDMQAVESESLAVADLIDKLQAKQKELQDKITDKSKELQQQAQDLESKRAILSASAMEEKRKGLERDLLNFQNTAQKENLALEKAKQVSLSDIDNEVRLIVQSCAKNKELDLVLAEQVSLYLNKAKFTDLTKDVIKELNSKMKSIEFDKIFKNIMNEGAPVTNPPAKTPVVKKK